MTKEENKPVIKNLGGRPKKDVKGRMLWCPDFALESVQNLIASLKQQRTQQ
jgi:hypothetical protein